MVSCSCAGSWHYEALKDGRGWDREEWRMRMECDRDGMEAGQGWERCVMGIGSDGDAHPLHSTTNTTSSR